MTTADMTVFIADDDAAMRDSLEALLTARGLAAEAFPSGDALLERMTDGVRGCVLLDYRMPGRDGLAILGEIQKLACPPPVIIITAHGDVSVAVRAMKTGAFDFIEKPWATQDLFAIIDRALAVEAERLETVTVRETARQRLAALTPRERDVMRGLIEGASNKVIARKLDLSPRTVEFHRARVLEKTGAANIADLVRLALTAGDAMT